MLWRIFEHDCLALQLEVLQLTHLLDLSLGIYWLL